MNLVGERRGTSPDEGKGKLREDGLRPMPIEASAGAGSGLSGHATQALRATEVAGSRIAKPLWNPLLGIERRQAQRRQRDQTVLLDTRLRERRTAGLAVARIRCSI